MADGDQIIQSLNTLPGIQRDGTSFDSRSYVDGQWVRFQRGRPKKMGGYREISGTINGPVRAVNTWTRQSLIQVTLFSSFGVEVIQVDKNGVGQALYDRTPSGFSIDGNAIWQVDTMYDSAVGSAKTLIFAHPGANLTDIDSGIPRNVYYGDAADTAPLDLVTGGLSFISGGLVAIPPYLCIYGSDGLISWSNENEPRNFATGSAGTARITGSKIVKGLPVRGQGASPSALLWSLDSVIRMSWIGGQDIFKFDPVTNGSSILSSSSVIEYDGKYFWVGLDRFLMYNGSVQELVNTQNKDWFYDNLNYEQRQKVHATKIPRFGEIWWFFPKGDATECSHAVIYNVREGYWYDVELPRSSASFSQVFRYPMMLGAEVKNYTTRLTVASVSNFVVGDTITGATSHTTGTIVKIIGSYIYATLKQGSGWQLETVSGTQGGSSAVSEKMDVPQHQLWLHETGNNKVEGDNEFGIVSFFESSNFGFPVGGVDGQGSGPDRWTRVTRIEPDFKSQGEMRVEVVGGEAAQGEETASDPYIFGPETTVIDLREQKREIRLRFTSDVMNGDYEMGRVLMHLEEGDGRS